MRSGATGQQSGARFQGLGLRVHSSRVPGMVKLHFDFCSSSSPFMSVGVHGISIHASAIRVAAC